MRQQDADEEQTKPNRTNFLLLKKNPKKPKLETTWTKVNLKCIVIYYSYDIPCHATSQSNQTKPLPLLLHLPTQKKNNKRIIISTIVNIRA